jgi:hypothetical protein
MTKLRALAVLLVLVAVLSLPFPTRPGIEGLGLTVAFSNRVLTDNLFTDIIFRFGTSRNFVPFTEDLTIVCRLFSEGRLLAEDMYKPSVSTSKWEARKAYSFTRKIYIPSFIDVYDPGFKGSKTIDLTVGLAAGPAGSVPVRGKIYEAKIRTLPAPEFPVIVYLSGWYEPETEPGEPRQTRRWTAKEARCAIDNPGRDAQLVIRGSLDAKAVPGQRITIRLAGRVIDEFTPEKPEFERFYEIKKDWLGEGKDFLLVIGVDKTFVPARVIPGSGDKRELGVRISLLYFR